MNSPGQQILAGARFSEQEHGRVAGGHQVGQAHHFLERGALADDLDLFPGGAHLFLQACHAALQAASFVEQRREALAIALAGLVELGVGDADGRLRREGLEPGHVQGPRRRIAREARRIEADHAERVVAHHQRHGERGTKRRRMHSSDIEPAIVIASVGHEHDPAAREGQPHDAGVGWDLDLTEGVGARTAERDRAQVPLLCVVQQHPARRGAEHVLHGVQRRFGRACHVQAGGEGARCRDEGVFNRTVARIGGVRGHRNSGSRRRAPPD